jgi:tungstate transport system ATP-binding protein
MLDRVANMDAKSDAEAAAAPGEMLPVVTKGLTLAIAGKALVDSVDLSLPGSTVTMVMGPNGAGKSLLLRLLHGMLQPTGGSVLWGGQPLSKELRKRQAMVFQRPVLLRRSVAANIDFVLKLGGKIEPERRDEILDHVGLLDHARQPARLLSGGEQQRLALARALALEPEVLFLDEPTASLDPASVLMIEQIVLGAHRRGTKIIFISHDIGQAKRLGDEIVFLHNGRLAEHTPAGRFFANPSSEAAQAYLEGRIVL